MGAATSRHTFRTQSPKHAHIHAPLSSTSDTGTNTANGLARDQPRHPDMALPQLPAPVPLPIPRPVAVPAVPRARIDNEPDSDPFLLIPTHSGPGISRQSLTRVAGWLAWGSLALALILPLLILGVSERWWVSAALVYLPRQPWLIPPLLAVLATALWNRQALALAAVALVGTAGPVMGLSLGNFPGGLFAADVPATTPGSIRVVSANVQAFKPDFPAMFAEIGRLSPDVVVFQEAFGDHRLVADLFAGWHVLREEEYLVASRWPVEKLGLCESATFDRNCAYAARVKHPQGDFAVGNIHFATARFGLQRLSPRAILTGVGPEELSEHITRREAEALATRTWLEELRRDLPLLAVGDFNMPVESNILESAFGDLHNAFTEAGLGYGYTAPNKTRTWPMHTPWSRVDHVLVSDEWTIHAAGTGAANGSDHKLVWATVGLPTAP
jgi:endonuclease/exonuclease/phosphatase family metal-dependent hydrolase